MNYRITFVASITTPAEAIRQAPSALRVTNSGTNAEGAIFLDGEVLPGWDEETTDEALESIPAVAVYEITQRDPDPQDTAPAPSFEPTRAAHQGYTIDLEPSGVVQIYNRGDFVGVGRWDAANERIVDCAATIDEDIYEGLEEALVDALDDNDDDDDDEPAGPLPGSPCPKCGTVLSAFSPSGRGTAACDECNAIYGE